MKYLLLILLVPILCCKQLSKIETAVGVIGVSDTSSIKLLNAAEGQSAYLKQLSSGNKNGGGLMRVIDSTYTEGIVAYDHPIIGKQWVRVDFQKNEEVNVLWSGAYNDSTNGITTHTAINNACLDAYNLGKVPVYFPEGVYNIDTLEIHLRPGSHVYGEGMDLTKVYQRLDNLPTNMHHFINKGSVDYSGQDSIYNDYYIHDLTIQSSAATNFDGLPFTNEDADDGGIYIARGDGGDNINRVVIERVRAISCGVGIQAKTARFTKIKDCKVYKSPWYAYTQTGTRVECIHNFADSVQAGMEIYGSNEYSVRDSLGSVLIMGNEIRNCYDMGMLISSYSEIKILNNVFTGAGYNLGDNNGIHIATGWDTPTSTQRKIFRKKRSALIQSNTFTNFYCGIYNHSFGQNIPDTLFHAIDIINNECYNNLSSGIMLFKNTNDELIGKPRIIGNKCYNNNQIGSATARANIFIKNLDSVLVRSNTCYYDSLVGSNRGASVVLNSCNGTLIEDNDFRHPLGQYFIYENTNCNSTMLINNQGLDKDGALRHVEEHYPQNVFSNGQGKWYGRPLTENKVYLLSFIENEPKVVMHNTSGAAIDTFEIYSSWFDTTYSEAYTPYFKKGTKTATVSLEIPPTNYDWHETFEAFGTDCTWNDAFGNGTWEPDTSSANMEGTSCLFINGKETRYADVSGTDDDFELGCIVKIPADSGGIVFVQWANSSGGVIGLLTLASGSGRFYPRLWYNGVSRSKHGLSMTWSDDTVYYIRMTYDNGSGSDGKYRVYYSTHPFFDWTPLKELSVDDATDTAQIGRLYLGYTTTWQGYFIDDIKVNYDGTTVSY